MERDGVLKSDVEILPAFMIGRLVLERKVTCKFTLESTRSL